MRNHIYIIAYIQFFLIGEMNLRDTVTGKHTLLIIKYLEGKVQDKRGM